MVSGVGVVGDGFGTQVFEFNMSCGLMQTTNK